MSILFLIFIMIVVYAVIYLTMFVFNDDLTTFFKIILGFPLAGMIIAAGFIFIDSTMKIKSPETDKTIVVARSAYVDDLVKEYNQSSNQLIELKLKKITPKTKIEVNHLKVAKKEVPQEVTDFANKIIDLNSTFYDNLHNNVKPIMSDKMNEENKYLTSVIGSRSVMGSSNIFTPNDKFDYSFNSSVTPYNPDFHYSISMSQDDSPVGILYFSFDNNTKKINIENVVWTKSIQGYAF
ncbi:hypothetical protein [Pseudolactococcus insecticola]|uniref:Uncharacterized protein n=1 Tax=Pseudolactococcus insecticola TaxID=2709158 RepID=A0A6A0B8U6_9LACT|nr:hypothetical protein [Lactococcus insecticola]GFH41266.1 hypothetical protein Hs20B_16640 [Lactococcus insecticola]